jgi:hypothetical protein
MPPTDEVSADQQVGGIVTSDAVYESSYYVSQMVAHRLPALDLRICRNPAIKASRCGQPLQTVGFRGARKPGRLRQGPAPNGSAAARRTASTGSCSYARLETDIVNRTITLYEFFESNMRAGPGQLDVLVGGADEVAAVADAHRVITQDVEQFAADLEQLAARSDRGT